jgi:aldehyde:ferredoxin oxidoreductase
MPKGYTGKILHVDLSHRKIEVEENDEGFYRSYLGGRIDRIWGAADLAIII